MDALDALGQQGNDFAIATDIVVVATLAVFCHSAGYQRFYTERAVAFVGHVVDDQEFHGVVMEGLQFLVHSCY